MWISRSSRARTQGPAQQPRDHTDILCSTAACVWIMPVLDMIVAYLSLAITTYYRIINTCGKRVGSITPCKAASLADGVRRYTGRRVPGLCG